MDDSIVVLRGDRGHRDWDGSFGFLLFVLVRFPDVFAVELGHLLGRDFTSGQRVRGHFLGTLLGRSGHQLLPGERDEHRMPLEALVVFESISCDFGVYNRCLLCRRRYREDGTHDCEGAGRAGVDAAATLTQNLLQGERRRGTVTTTTETPFTRV